MNDRFIIVSLPSIQVDHFSKTLDCDQGGTSEQSLIDFFKNIDQVKSQFFILSYQTPWEYLRQKIQTSDVLITGVASAESDTIGILKEWYSYYRLVFQYHRRFKDRSLLVNLEKLQDYGKLRELIETRLGFKVDYKKGFSPLQIDKSKNNDFSSYFPFVGKLSPECVDLYTELESSADLLGRKPDFNFDEALASKNLISECLDQTYAYSRIKKQLGQYFPDTNGVYEQIELLLEKMDNVVEEKVRSKEAQSESELLLLQLHQVQEELEITFSELQEEKGQGDVEKLNKENELLRVIAIEYKKRANVSLIKRILKRY